MQVRKQQLGLDMEQQTGSKLGKEYIKVIYCHPAYLTYMHSTSCGMPGWMNHKLESRLLGEKSIISDMQMISLQIKRHLLLGRKAITNLDSILESRGIILLTQVLIVKAMIFQ